MKSPNLATTPNFEPWFEIECDNFDAGVSNPGDILNLTGLWQILNFCQNWNFS